MYIKALNEISKNNVKLVGGKGTSLGELTKAGFPVPPGFVITTEGFQKNIEKEVLGAFDKLNSEKVAVRSSAIAEDSLSASWAGQLETYLNVSREELINKVEKCWDSIKSERVKSYTSGQNLQEEQMRVAVVVQEMVDSQSAGVMFTVNPVSKDGNEVMIESILGLGESLVQGLVTPDNFIIDKQTLEMENKDLAKEQTIPDENIKKLVELGKKIENYYGSPQDIEWAIDKDGKIWVLQSRPITTLTSPSTWGVDFY